MACMEYSDGWAELEVKEVIYSVDYKWCAVGIADV